MKKKNPEFTLRLLRDDDTECEPEHESHYFRGGTETHGIVYRGGTPVGEFTRNYAGHLIIFNRDIRRDHYALKRKYKLESLEPWGRVQTFKHFQGLLEKLYQESLDYPFEYYHRNTARWFPIAEHMMKKIINSESTNFEHSTSHALTCREILDRGEMLTIKGVEYQRRVSSLERYDIKYPHGSEYSQISRSVLFKQFPELEPLFKNFGVSFLRELKLQTVNGMIEIHGNHWTPIM